MENPFEIIIERLDNIEKLLKELTKREITGDQSSMPDEIMTVDQVAIYLSLAKPTIYGKCASREIPCFKVGKRNYFMQAAEGNRRCGTCRCSGCIWNRADEAWKSGMPGGGSEVQSSFEAGRKAGKIVGNGLSLS